MPIGMDTSDQLARRPGVQRVPSPKLDLFIRKRFLEPEECARLVALIDAERRPSTIADDSGDGLFRTSETCDLDSSDPDAARGEERVAAATGPYPAHGEPVPGQRDAQRHVFIANTDNFEPPGSPFAADCSAPGPSPQNNW